RQRGGAHAAHRGIVDGVKAAILCPDQHLITLLAAARADNDHALAPTPPVPLIQQKLIADKLVMAVVMFVLLVTHASLPFNWRLSRASRMPSNAPCRAPPKSPLVAMFCSM